MPRSVLLRLLLGAIALGAATPHTTAAASSGTAVTAYQRSASARVTVRVTGHPQRVTLSLDGRRIAIDRHAPFTFRRVDTRRLRPGTHHLRAIAYYRRARSAGRARLRTRARGVVVPGRNTLAVALGGVREGQSVSGPVALTAAARGGYGGTSRVEFWVDGARRAIDRTAPYSSTWTPGADGRHVVAAVAYNRYGMKAVSTLVGVIAAGAVATGTAVLPPAPTRTDRQPAQAQGPVPVTVTIPAPLLSPLLPPARDTLWSSSFDNGSSQPTEWSYWGQGNESDYGRPEVVSAASTNLPDPPGKRVVRLYHGSGDPARHHKLYKSFRANTWPDGAEPAIEASSPTDVSGSYSCRLYLPSKNLDLGNGGWIGMVQFKEDFTDPNGGFHSNPDYWFGMNNDLGHPSFDLNSWSMKHKHAEIDARPYLDKWFTVEMRLYQGDRLEVYLDGKLVDTGRQSEFPVGRRYFVGQKDEDGNAIAQNKGWTFGVGNYVGTTEQESLLYVDGCALRRLP